MTTHAISGLRIVHVCNFHYNKHADKFDTMDQKIHQGLCENGHFVYAFPFHDISRQSTWTNSKRIGATKANRALMDTVDTIRPDLLLLGHSQSVTTATLQSLRQSLPDMRIAQWFCDWFYSGRAFKYAFIFDRLKLLDAFFATTGGDKLNQFNQYGCRAFFIPNLVHPAIEKYRAFEQLDFDYDLVFFGTDRKDPERRESLRLIQQNLDQELRIGIFGSLDQPPVYGAQKEFILSRSKAALNLTRLPEPMPLYSSDRIANLLGNGLLTCTRSDIGLQHIYGPDAMLYYHDLPDLIAQLATALQSENWRDTARIGWERCHQTSHVRLITARMLECIYRQRQDCITLQT